MMNSDRIPHTPRQLSPFTKGSTPRNLTTTIKAANTNSAAADAAEYEMRHCSTATIYSKADRTEHRCPARTSSTSDAPLMAAPRKWTNSYARRSSAWRGHGGADEALPQENGCQVDHRENSGTTMTSHNSSQIIPEPV